MSVEEIFKILEGLDDNEKVRKLEELSQKDEVTAYNVDIIMDGYVW